MRSWFVVCTCKWYVFYVKDRVWLGGTLSGWGAGVSGWGAGESSALHNPDGLQVGNLHTYFIFYISIRYTCPTTLTHPPLFPAPHLPSTQHLYNHSPHPDKVPQNQTLPITLKKTYHIHVRTNNKPRPHSAISLIPSTLHHLTTTLHILHQWTKTHYSYFSRFGHQKAVLANLLLKMGIIMLETCWVNKPAFCRIQLVFILHIGTCFPPFLPLHPWWRKEHLS
jgi:hypothetical protein